MRHPFPPSRRPSPTALICLVVLAAWLGPKPPARAQGLTSSSEYIAAFVRYVRWPDGGDPAAWTVCIFGPLPLGQERAYDHRTAQGRPFAVRRLTDEDSAAGCQVLDMTAADLQAGRRRLAEVRRMPVLTVGSGPAFCSAGGHICLLPGGGDRGFDINLSALGESGLGISARLLKLVAADFEAEPSSARGAAAGGPQ